MKFVQDKSFYEKFLKSRIAWGYIAHNAIRLTAIDDGYAQGEIDVSEQTLNPLGIVHGGAIAGLADSVAGCAAATTGNKIVTSDCLLTYLRPAIKSPLLCTAQVRKSGRMVCIVTASIVDGAGTEVAMGTFNFAVLGKRSMTELEAELLRVTQQMDAGLVENP